MKIIQVADRSIRIWNNYDRAEIAKLMHNCPVVSVLWMDDDSGIISLGKDGLVSKWTRDVRITWYIFIGFPLTLVEILGHQSLAVGQSS